MTLLLTTFIRPVSTTVVFLIIRYWQEQNSLGVHRMFFCPSHWRFSTLLWTVLLKCSKCACMRLRDTGVWGCMRLRETFPPSICVSAAGKLQCHHCWMMKGDFNRISHYCGTNKPKAKADLSPPITATCCSLCTCGNVVTLVQPDVLTSLVA